MPSIIPEGINRDHVLEAISRFDAGTHHEFADSTAYDLLFNDRRYPPKAIVGIASEVLTGVQFTPKDFKAGVDSKCFRILKSNGFMIVPKITKPKAEDSDKNLKWGRDELKASVEAYLQMQRMARNGEKFTKKSIYEPLAGKFGRTIKSVEYRMQNISFVLSLHGREWLRGLPPAANVGTNVAAQIESILAEIEEREANYAIAFEASVERKLANPNTFKPTGKTDPKKITTSATGYDRCPEVKAWVLNNSNGICESCERPAPFVTSSGRFFLEVHHVRAMADGGSDRVENAVAICPNCHRGFHHSRDKDKMVERLFSRVARLIKE
jgi:5-methylcytosine-specific restriction protein A